jgi:hypothetical protein
MAGSPVKKERRDRTRAAINDPEFWRSAFDAYSTGGSLRETCQLLDVAYNTTWDHLQASDELMRQYEAARYRRAEWHSSQIERMAVEVESGELDPKAGKVAIETRMWLASKMDPKQWGERQQIDMNVTTTHKLHMDAIRTLSAQKARRQARLASATDAPVLIEQLPSAALEPRQGLQPIGDIGHSAADGSNATALKRVER